MGRIRTIKPEFWEDDKVGQLSPLARLVFIGSWNLADDAGRLRWSPDYINASLFMYDRLTTKKVAALMAEVEKQGLVTPYEARGQQLAFVPGWTHQRIERPSPARFPPPPGGDESEADSRSHSRSDSVNESVSDSGGHSLQEGKGREGSREQGGEQGGGAGPAPPGGAVALASPPSVPFDGFWRAYPARDGKRLGRAKSEDRWRRLTDAERESALVGATNLACAIAAGGKFGPPDPERWLRDRRWEEWQEPAVVTNGHGPRLSRGQEVLARMGLPNGANE